MRSLCKYDKVILCDKTVSFWEHSKYRLFICNSNNNTDCKTKDMSLLQQLTAHGDITIGLMLHNCSIWPLQTRFSDSDYSGHASMNVWMGLTSVISTCNLHDLAIYTIHIAVVTIIHNLHASATNGLNTCWVIMTSASTIEMFLNLFIKSTSGCFKAGPRLDDQI